MQIHQHNAVPLDAVRQAREDAYLADLFVATAGELPKRPGSPWHDCARGDRRVKHPFHRGLGLLRLAMLRAIATNDPAKVWATRERIETYLDECKRAALADCPPVPAASPVEAQIDAVRESTEAIAAIVEAQHRPGLVARSLKEIREAVNAFLRYEQTLSTRGVRWT